ncbi:hypothetical protein WOA01_11830 [Methylocystis sp. IM2]|uniref:hypothetical protein n=1 Tax=Methylocystis sp. IM2 TaxID=3136563 RepID=UPI0030F6DE12
MKEAGDSVRRLSFASAQPQQWLLQWRMPFVDSMGLFVTKQPWLAAGVTTASLGAGAVA